MSIKKILGIVIFIGIIVFVIYLQYEHNTRKNQDIMIKRHNKRYIKDLSCTPKKTIDKGIIYAEAMKQYWEWKIDSIWKNYQYGLHGFGTEEFDRRYSEELEKECGLKDNILGKPKFTKNTCLPLVNSINKSLRIYNPKKDNYLYQPENYNKNVNFIVNMRSSLYKEDCCKLFTYEEMKNEMNNIKETDDLKIHQYMIKNIDIELLSKVYFLRVIENGKDYRNREYVQYNYYPVSLCGNVP